jgi:hypothetical protein
MDEQRKSWETYLRNEKELLREHRGEYVAIRGTEIVGIGEDMEKLAKMVYRKYGSEEALICKIEEEEEPIQMPPSRIVMN